MKKVIRNILFGSIPVTEYSTVTVTGDIIEKVYLETGNTSIDVSATHWLLCLTPAVFGVWITDEKNSVAFDNNSQYKMYFTNSEKPATTEAVVQLSYVDKIEEKSGTLLLLQVTGSSTHHINFIRTRLIFHKYYKKPEQDFNKLTSYAAAYSYPRRVRLVSFKEGDYYNIFPMDLVGDIPNSNRYVFGLRHTNMTLAKIMEAKKLVIAEVPYQYKDVIYRLGKYHRNPISATEMRIDLLESEQFKFPIPAWANSYKEIQILKTLNLGSQMLLWGEEINQVFLNNPAGSHLFHIHFLHYLHQQKRGLAYPLV
jgi:hypothetical protein